MVALSGPGPAKGAALVAPLQRPDVPSDILPGTHAPQPKRLIDGRDCESPDPHPHARLRSALPHGHALRGHVPRHARSMMSEACREGRFRAAAP